jgi:hypothetical protein
MWRTRSWWDQPRRSSEVLLADIGISLPLVASARGMDIYAPVNSEIRNYAFVLYFHAAVEELLPFRP